MLCIAAPWPCYHWCGSGSRRPALPHAAVTVRHRSYALTACTTIWQQINNKVENQTTNKQKLKEKIN
jgi:hypothetical protein